MNAIANSLWQAAALATLIWLAMKALQSRLNAATRHLIWWIVLAAVVILPVIPRRQAPAPPPVRRTIASTLPVPVPAPFEAPESAPLTVTRRRASLWPWAIVAIWAAIFLVRVVNLVRSYRHLRRVKQQSTEWPRPLPRRARLLISSAISSPVAVGFLHPAVILPENLRQQLTDAEMNCVLLHEAAHLARFDDWSNLAARAVGAVLALHPVVWFVLREIEREREMACDDWVVAHTGTARRYAQSLARVVELRIRPAESLLGAGIFTRRARLLERIEMLLRRDRIFSSAAARGPLIAAGLTLAILTAAGALAPHWIAFAQRLEFEVASVKIATDGPFEFVPKRSGDRVSIHMTHIYSVISYAYHITGTYQVIGYPEEYSWYDIDAKIGRDATDDEVRLMFQSMLEDRFKFKAHHETRELPEFELSIAKGKPKMTPSTSDEPMKLEIEGRKFSQRPGTCGVSGWNDGAHLICHAAPMEAIISPISGQMHAPVADHTGLTGTYDLNLIFIVENAKLRPDGPTGPSLNEALQSELGLKLEKGKGPVEVLVIDHIEKASAN